MVHSLVGSLLYHSPMTSLYTIIFAAILQAFLLVLYIWWKDKYQREPFSPFSNRQGVLVACIFEIPQNSVVFGNF